MKKKSVEMMQFQIDLFDYAEELLQKSMVSGEASSKDRESTENGNSDGSETDEDYSLLGIRLATMAKSLADSVRNYTDVSKKLFAQKYEQNPYLEDLLKQMSHVIRPVLRKITAPVEESAAYRELQSLTSHIKWRLSYFDELFSEYALDIMPEMVPDENWFSCYPAGVSIYHLSRKRKFDAGEKTMYLYCPDVFPGACLCGTQIGTSNYKNAYFKTSMHLKGVDMAYAISWLILLDTVWDNFLSDDLRKSYAFHEFSKKCRDYFFVHDNAINVPEDYKPSALNGKTVILYTEMQDPLSIGVRALEGYLLRRGCRLYILYAGRRINYMEHPLFQVGEELLPKFMQRELLEWSSGCKNGSRPWEFYRKFQEAFLKCPTVSDIPVFIHGQDLASYLVWDSTANENFNQEDVLALISTCFNIYNSELWQMEPLPRFHHVAGAYSGVGIAMQLFLEMAGVMEHEIIRMRESGMEGLSHARSFETKKSIPKKILHRMKSSVLNERFGYVEFDEKCDLESVKIMEAQILDFLESCFPDTDLNSVSLRFRRLGNHRASGLYYPTYKCICIDIDSPSSFIHEFGHCLDHLMGDLSNCLNSREFKQLYDAYVHELDRKLAGIKLSGKYDRKYYVRETEVFARCFETYYYYVKGRDNSLTCDGEYFSGSNSAFAYHPESEYYMTELRRYFESLDVMKHMVVETETLTLGKTAS